MNPNRLAMPRTRCASLLTWASAFLASLLLPSFASAQQPERATFYLIEGADTAAIERVTRSPARLDGDLFDGTHGIRWTYVLTLAPSALVSQMDNNFFRSVTDPTPTQRARLRFVGDSVIADISGNVMSTQRISSMAGALPYLNPSAAMIEQVLMRARVVGGNSTRIPIFLVEGGQTLPATVTWIGRDSATVAIATTTFRASVAPDGRLLGAIIPTQRVRIVRMEGLRHVYAERADYSVPPGAPYTAEEMSVRTRTGLKLVGTLTLPTARSSRGAPAVVMITGSGPEDRDEAIPSISGYRPFRQIADTLGRRGIAVLRLDDRGMGGSDTGPSGATTADFADDIRAGLTYLRSLPDIDRTRLGLIGHSEGAMIAPMIAVTDTSLKAIVLLASPSRTGRRVIAYQQRYAIEHASQTSAPKRDSLIAVAARSMDSLAVVQPWLRYALAYNPSSTAERVKTPVLILQGATDRQVTADQAPELAAAFRTGGNRDVTVTVFPDTDHLFLADPSGNSSGYATLPSKRVRPEVLGAIADWLTTRLR